MHAQFRYTFWMPALQGVVFLLAMVFASQTLAAEPLSDPLSEQDRFKLYFKAQLAGYDYDYEHRADAFYALYETGHLPDSDHLTMLESLVFSGHFLRALDVAETLYQERGIGVVNARALVALQALHEGRSEDALALSRLPEWLAVNDVIRPLIEAWSLAATGQDMQAMTVLDSYARDFEVIQPLLPALQANLLLYAGRPAAAIALLNAAEDKPGLLPGSVEMAIQTRALLALGADDDMQSILTDYISRNPGGALNRIDLHFLQTGKPLLPIANDALTGFSQAMYLLAETLYRQAPQIRIQLMRLAQFASPDDDHAILILADSFIQLGKPRQAHALLTGTPADSPYRLEISLLLSDVFYSLARFNDMKALLYRIYEETPSHRDIVLKLGWFLRLKGEYQESIAIYDRAIAEIDTSASDDWLLHYGRAIAYDQLEQWPLAERDLLQALNLDPENPSVLNYLGYIWIDRMIRTDEAFAMIRKAAALRANDGAIIDSLGWAYYQHKKYEQAVHYLEQAVQLIPHDPIINDHLGDAYWKTGRRKEARFQWRRALQYNPDAKLIMDLMRKLDQGLALPDPT